MLARLLGTGVMVVLLGCSPPPAPVPRGGEHAAAARASLADPAPAASPSPAATASADPRAQEGRFLAYTAWQPGFGNLFLWDAWGQDIYLLNGALAGLSVPAGQTLRPRVAAKGEKVLFCVGEQAFYWDLSKEERTTPVTDGRAFALGGPQAVITPDGKWIAYVSVRETLVFRTLEGVNISKVVEPVEVSAEGPLWDLDMTGDATRFVLNIGGRAYFYDHWNRRLRLLLPLDGLALAWAFGPLGEVAIAPSGGALAFAWEGGRVTLTDPWGRLVETLPTLDLVDGRVVDLYFLSDELLIAEVLTRGALRVFAYDRLTGLLRVLVLANDPLPIPVKHTFP